MFSTSPIGFRGAEIPKRLPYRHEHFQLQSTGHFRTGTGVVRLPDSILWGCRYWLELCIDPPRLPRLVPAAPGFPLRPHDGFPPCVKPTSRDRVVPSRAPPGGDFHHLHLRQGSFGFNAVAYPPPARFRVAQSHHCGVDWVEPGIAARSARRSRTSPTTGIRLQRVLSRDWWSRPDRIGGPAVPRSGQ